MTKDEVEAFVSSLDDVEREENFGYSFFFVGEDHRLPFVTIADSDNEYDNVSNLDREGVFRVNIGVTRETFGDVVGNAVPESPDYTALNVILPHPDYAKQNFVCISSPSPENEGTVRDLITEAHSIAMARSRRGKND